jgi:hypothetical protein
VNTGIQKNSINRNSVENQNQERTESLNGNIKKPQSMPILPEGNTKRSGI